MNNAPTAPVVTNAIPASATSVRVDWDTPSLDGCSVIQQYLVEYDVDSNFAKSARSITVPAANEVHSLQVGSI